MFVELIALVAEGAVGLLNSEFCLTFTLPNGVVLVPDSLSPDPGLARAASMPWYLPKSHTMLSLQAGNVRYVVPALSCGSRAGGSGQSENGIEASRAACRDFNKHCQTSRLLCCIVAFYENTIHKCFVLLGNQAPCTDTCIGPPDTEPCQAQTRCREWACFRVGLRGGRIDLRVGWSNMSKTSSNLEGRNLHDSSPGTSRRRHMQIPA